ncbi:MAG TPA: chloride channel protein [Pseudolabrys sp.]|jgi:CIC family chloride channel protein
MLSPLSVDFPRRLRALVRAREISIIALAALVGAVAGLTVAGMGLVVDLMHTTLFALPPEAHLSGAREIEPLRALVPLAGGILFGISLALLARWRPSGEVDPIEANALHGGRMSFRGSLIVACQTMWSSGVGASVGLEAGYTQLASGIASNIGRRLRLRRPDLRLLVGCGAAAAISGAFGAPIAGAFYAFELIIGSYTPASLAPVGIAALNGYLATHWLRPTGIIAASSGTVAGSDLLIASLLGLAAALLGITLMRGVALWERVSTTMRVPVWLRPAIGGALVGALALVSPQVLGSGHGALHLTAMVEIPLATIALIFVLKSLASVISLGSGFRGGLFFASLLIGALGGRLFAAGGNWLWPDLMLNPDTYAVIGMGALSASVIGGPLTMTFIALESTGDFWLATAVLVAVILSAQLTRELFGYSFATWRFHLRGQTIRSAADVGWLRDLTVGRMMRRDVKTVPDDLPLADFRQRIPLGSTSHAVAVDPDGNYAGMVIVAEAHGVDNPDVRNITPLLHQRDVMLVPTMNAKEAAAAFDREEAESLAVVSSFADRKVIGLMSEAYTLRRYAEESDRRRRELLGEG